MCQSTNNEACTIRSSILFQSQHSSLISLLSPILSSRPIKLIEAPWSPIREGPCLASGVPGSTVYYSCTQRVRDEMQCRKLAWEMCVYSCISKHTSEKPLPCYEFNCTIIKKKEEEKNHTFILFSQHFNSNIKPFFTDTLSVLLRLKRLIRICIPAACEQFVEVFRQTVL